MRNSNLLCLSVLLGAVIAGSGSLPPNWWEQSKARPIASYADYLNLVNGEAKNKFVFIDFYMEYCPWCYYILDDFNRLIDDMHNWYGPEKVEVIKIDGQKNRKLADQFKVKSYPSFAAAAPNTGGKPFSFFSYQPRSYDTLKKWMLEVMGTTPMRQSSQESTFQGQPPPQQAQEAVTAPIYAQQQ